MKLFERRARVHDDWVDDPWDSAGLAWTDQTERLRHQSGVAKGLVATLAVIMVVIALLGGAVGLWYLHKVNPAASTGPPVNVAVSADDTLITLSERLQKDGIIADAGVFQFYVKQHGGLSLVPGYYTLRPNDHMGNIVQVLRTPPNETFADVTFPEGFTMRQMGARLAETIPGLDAGTFLDKATDGTVTSIYQPEGSTNLEGLLFPDTYRIAGNETEVQVLRRMEQLMERVGRQEDIEAKAAALGMSPYQILVVASMIEREAKVAEDRPKIARVILNRLFLATPLQIDATLYYGQDPGTAFSVLRATDTPYNTYLHTGLPPTPIANPGRASIQAALNPTPNPINRADPLCAGVPDDQPCIYLYYVLADADGRHAFAATFDQHQINVDKARAAGLVG